MQLPPVAILAGGRGTRLGALVSQTPKPLLEVAGEPFLFHQLRQLQVQRAKRVVLCVGYLGEAIETAVGNGSSFGLDVTYSYDEEPGTAAALRHAVSLLGDAFLVLYSDTYLEIDYADVTRVFRASGLPALMTVLPWPRGNALYGAGRIRRYQKGEGDQELRWIDYGLEAFTAETVSTSTENDLADLQHRLAANGLLAGYLARQPFHEIGTPKALRETDAFLRSLSGPRASARSRG